MQLSERRDFPEFAVLTFESGEKSPSRSTKHSKEGRGITGGSCASTSLEAEVRVRSSSSRQEMSPPSAPLLEEPEPGRHRYDSRTPRSSWSFEAPEGHSVTYEFVLLKLRTDEVVIELVGKRLEGQTLTIESSLDPTVDKYLWRVTAVDEYGATTESPVGEFTISGPGSLIKNRERF